MTLGFAVVDGHSMIPVLVPGDKVLVRYGAAFKLGSIVLVDRGDRIDVKRVTRLEDAHVFVEGDNSEVSTDSRHYGAVSPAEILGVVIWRLPRRKVSRR